MGSQDICHNLLKRSCIAGTRQDTICTIIEQNGYEEHLHAVLKSEWKKFLTSFFPRVAAQHCGGWVSAKQQCMC